MSSTSQRLVLASESARRLSLLRQIGLEPHHVEPAALDETQCPRETPRELAIRLAAAKAEAVAQRHRDAFVLAADTVVCLGRRVLSKAETDAEGRASLQLLSGRGHKVLTAVHLIGPAGQAARVSETRLRFKRLTSAEIDTYVRSGEGLGKAGGYAIQGRAGAFIIRLQGSYSSVVGLPLYETACLLQGLGYVIG